MKEFFGEQLVKTLQHGAKLVLAAKLNTCETALVASLRRASLSSRARPLLSCASLQRRAQKKAEAEEAAAEGDAEEGRWRRRGRRVQVPWGKIFAWRSHIDPGGGERESPGLCLLMGNVLWLPTTLEEADAEEDES